MISLGNTQISGAPACAPNTGFINAPWLNRGLRLRHDRNSFRAISDFSALRIGCEVTSCPGITARVDKGQISAGRLAAVFGDNSADGLGFCQQITFQRTVGELNHDGFRLFGYTGGAKGTNLHALRCAYGRFGCMATARSASVKRAAQRGAGRTGNILTLIEQRKILSARIDARLFHRRIINRLRCWRWRRCR